jgi:hypothetical protein
VCKLLVREIDVQPSFCYKRDIAQAHYPDAYERMSGTDLVAESDAPSEPLQKIETSFDERPRRPRGKFATLRTHRDGTVGGPRKCILRKLALRVRLLTLRGEPA